jgi:hypothetical protein
MRIRGRYIMLDRIEEAEKMGGLDLEYSQSDSERMTVQKGTVIDFGNQVKGIEKGEICYYNKSRAFDIKLKGETYTMVDEGYIILLLPASSELS